MYLLRHMHEMVDIPEKFQPPEFQRLFILAEIGNFTVEEMKRYLNSLKNMSDYYNVIDTAAEIAEKRGREAAKLEDAARLKELGVGIDIISQATGLSLEEIERL